MSKKQDTYYFNNFIECTQYACQAARLLEETVQNFDAENLNSYFEKMHEIEHQADLKKHELTETLVKAFITPIEREDIVQVSHNIDNLVDKIEDVLIRIYFNRVTTIRPDALVLVQIITKCCDEVLMLMKQFAEFKHSKQIKEHIIKINSLEEEADKLYIRCMYDLHDSTADPLEVIAWRDIYTYLEKCADAAEHIADIAEIVIMKNT